MMGLDFARRWVVPSSKMEGRMLLDTPGGRGFHPARPGAIRRDPFRVLKYVAVVWRWAAMNAADLWALSRVRCGAVWLMIAPAITVPARPLRGFHSASPLVPLGSKGLQVLRMRRFHAPGLVPGGYLF